MGSKEGSGKLILVTDASTGSKTRMTQQALQDLLKRLQTADSTVVLATTGDGKKAIVNQRKTLYTF